MDYGYAEGGLTEDVRSENDELRAAEKMEKTN